MEPTKVSWATAGGGPAAGPAGSNPRPYDPLSLPAVSRGETTKAPWAAVSGPASAGRPVEAVIKTQPSLPKAVELEEATQLAFAPARKVITSAEQLKQFLGSEAAKDFVAYILALNEAVKGRQLSDSCHVSEAVAALKGVLDTLWQWVDEIPPAAHTLRYGNPAFRDWFARMAAAASELVSRVLPPHLKPAAAELAPYFIDSFGNATRIDYGTGHETTFCAFLYCLAKLGVLQQQDSQATVCVVFQRYLQLMRRVQTTYWLEPAGSHGVWGLDDYQFLPFIWGSAQLVDHPSITPSSIHNPDILAQYADEFLYLGCVKFVRQVKKGPLQETSPMLNDISGLPSWTKVNRGMIKMYQVEVLSKLPIMQHFLFGSLLPFSPPTE